jgi:hypothetical protein
MILRTVPLTLLLAVYLAGCAPTTRPVVWKAEDLVLGVETVFDVRPVANSTGHVVSPAVMSLLTEHLRQQFVKYDLPLADAPQPDGDVLSVQTEILAYKFQFFTGPPPPSGHTTGLCILRTRLLEKSSDRLVAEIVTVNRVNVGQGLLEPVNPDRFLRESSAKVAREVAGMM